MAAHGGARKGAGRRKKPVDPEAARRALQRIGEENEWVANYEKAKKQGNTTEAVRILTALRRFAYGDQVNVDLTVDLTARRERIRDLLSRLAGKAGS